MTAAPPPSDFDSSPDAPAAGDGAARIFEEARASSAAPAGRPLPTPPEALQAHFPDLEIGSVIGQGGMGVVYKARHRRLDRVVALKVLSAHLGEDPAFTERFAREARTMARLDHPHIVRVYDFGEADGLYYLVLEHVDGANLREVMRAGHLAPDEAIAIVPQLCEALQYAHDQGVVHRDIKPENVLLDKQGRVKVADFGLAKLAGHDAFAATLTGTGQVMGTPHYMAPEQYRTPQDVDHRADIFSLGVVFYEMLTGELPVGRFRAPSEAQVLDARIDAIVLRTLERERDLRYQHARDVESDVTRLSIAPDTPEPVPVSAASPSAGRTAAIVGLLALPAGLLVVEAAHGVWGGVERGTTEVFQRELFKAVAGGVVWLVGAGAGLVAAVRGAQASGNRWPHKAGVVLTVLNFLLLAGGAIYAMNEAERHAGLPRAGATSRAVEPPHLAAGKLRSGVEALWREVADALEQGPLAVDEALPFYAEADQLRLRTMSATDEVQLRRLRHLGVALLDPSAFGGDPAGHEVESVIRFGEGPFTVTLAHRDAPSRDRIVFHVVHEDGRWRLTLNQAYVTGER
jgi:tRNA A-37 threonylcarbamoyl transferase component Bud32